MCETEEILKKIELLRDKMINTASEKGFTCNESIKISQELDQLINYYNKIRFDQQTRKTLCKRKHNKS